jgi:hypothetical protein
MRVNGLRPSRPSGFRTARSATMRRVADASGALDQAEDEGDQRGAGRNRADGEPEPRHAAPAPGGTAPTV